MGRSLTLLCLALLAGTYASRYQFVSRTVPDSFTKKTDRMYDFQFSSIPSLPPSIRDWSVSAWMFIVSADYDGLYPLRVYYPDLHIKFYTATEIKIVNYATAGDGVMRTGVWFHVIVGANDSGTFGALTKRDGTQYSLAKTYYATADKDTRFYGATDIVNFTVSHM